MKGLFRAFLISSVIFPVYITYAQQACTPDPSYTEFGIYTSDTSGLPHGCENEPYSEVITAVIPDSLGGYPLIDVTLLSVNGLPDSMGYACNPSNCVFLPNTSACILLAGIPKTAGTYSIQVSLRVKVRVIFIPVTVDTTFTLGDFVVDAKDCAGVCGGSASVDACGICSGGTTGILPDCDDNDPCTADQCDGMGGCFHTDICLTIAGEVRTENGIPVKGVTMRLTGSDTQTVITGDSGEYHFIVWAGGNYVVEPFHDDDPAVTKGVSTADIVFIRRHILGTENLSSPYKIIAADANGSASISTLDIVITRSVILGSTAAFSNGRIWEFVRSDQIFPDPLSPFPFESTRTYTSLLTDQYGQNFIAVKLGDVNNSWTPAP